MDDAYDPEIIEEMKDNNTSAIVEEKIEDYEEAKKERDSADDLPYVPGEAVVAFEEGTSEEEAGDMGIRYWKWNSKCRFGSPSSEI